MPANIDYIVMLNILVVEDNGVAAEADGVPA